jgi:hypothetical protein
MSKEKTYTIEDIAIVDDAVALIQRKPSSFVGDDPNGAYFVGRLVQDLILLDAGPLRMARSGSWYSVSAERDWLMSEGGLISFEPFRRLMSMTSGGRLYDRTEVIIAALTDAVVTSGVDGVTWINGGPDHWKLPSDLDLSLTSKKGRIVAFHFSKFAIA